jgi:two-component system CheB/CheR fusion protein
MTILELQANEKAHTNVQIFASDLSKSAIIKARAGEYSLSQLEGIPADLLAKFYTRSGNNFRVAKVVREMCVFTEHNILRDPPF